ncbi:hypothetical protein HW555_013056, partial [Spodoptera exigua]
MMQCRAAAGPGGGRSPAAAAVGAGGARAWGARRRPRALPAPVSSLLARTMVAPRPLTSLALLLLLALAAAAPHPRMRRQLADDDALQPIEDGAGDDQTREKRKLEGVTQAKFGIKNAVLGFVFGKINSLIDAKTRLVDTLDKQNIELNKQYGIEAPQNGLASLSGIVGQSGTTSRRRELARTAGTPGIAHPSWSRRSRSTPATGRTRRQSDDIPVFDRNKVSLDLPGSLFGPSVSLLIRTTKIIGDVIQ